MDVEDYLGRIEYSGPRQPTRDTLFQLQARHQLTVPFENADIFEGRKKVLELPALFSKIVSESRGGWCCELNGLFCWLLRELGFTVSMVSASSWKSVTQEWNQPFDHMALLVYIGDSCYLTDVGWGGPIEHFEPIELKDGIISPQINGTFRLNKNGEFWILEMKAKAVRGHHREGENQDAMKNEKGEDSWTKVHRFDSDDKLLEDFNERCHQYQTDKESTILACIPCVLIKTEKGGGADMFVGRRYTNVKFHEDGDIRTNKLDLDDEQIKELLKIKFGINLNKNMVFMEKPSLGDGC